MLSREELRLINEILSDLDLDGDKEKLKRKMSLIVKQLDVMEKAQSDAAKIQEEIQELEGSKDVQEK